jgi:hypothetical protein
MSFSPEPEIYFKALLATRAKSAEISKDRELNKTANLVVGGRHLAGESCHRFREFCPNATPSTISM